MPDINKILGGGPSSPDRKEYEGFDLNRYKDYVGNKDGLIYDPVNKLQDIAAENQSGGEQLLKALPRFTGSTVTKFLQGASILGSVVGETAVGQFMDGEWNLDDVVNNPVNQLFFDLEDGLKKEFDIIKPTNWDDKSFFQQLGSTAWWADEFADGAAFAASSLIPAGLLGKAGLGVKAAGSLSRGLGNVSKGASWASKVMGGADEVSKLAKYTSAGFETAANNVAKWGAGLDKGIQYAALTTNEAMFEAKDAGDQVQNGYLERLGKTDINQLTEDEKADLKEKKAEAQKNTFMFNMIALAPSNLFELSLINKLVGKGGRVLAAEFADASGETAKRIQRKGVSKFFMENPIGYRTKNIAKGILAEGIYEENIQNAIQKVSEKYALDIEDDDLLSRIGETLKTGVTNLGDKEAWKAIGAGAVLGGLMGGAGKGKELKKKIAAADKAIAEINSNNFLDVKNSLYEKEEIFDTEGKGTGKFKRKLDADNKLIYNKTALEAFAKNRQQVADMTANEEYHRSIGEDDIADLYHNEKMTKWVMAHLEAGLETDLFAKINSLSSYKDEDLQRFGINPIAIDNQGNKKDKNTEIAKLKTEAARIKNIYDNVTKQVGDNSPFIDELVKTGSRIYHLQDKQKEFENRIASLRGSLEENVFVGEINQLQRDLNSLVKHQEAIKQLQGTEVASAYNDKIYELGFKIEAKKEEYKDQIAEYKASEDFQLKNEKSKMYEKDLAKANDNLIQAKESIKELGTTYEALTGPNAKAYIEKRNQKVLSTVLANIENDIKDEAELEEFENGLEENDKVNVSFKDSKGKEISGRGTVYVKQDGTKAIKIKDGNIEYIQSLASFFKAADRTITKVTQKELDIEQKDRELSVRKKQITAVLERGKKAYADLKKVQYELGFKILELEEKAEKLIKESTNSETLNKQLVKIENAIAELEQQIAINEVEKTKIEEGIIQVRNRLEFDPSIESVQQELEVKEKELEYLNKEIAEQKTLLQKLQDIYRRAKVVWNRLFPNKKEILGNENAYSHKEYIAAFGEITKNKERIDEATQLIEELEAERFYVKERIKNLKAEINTYNKELGKLETPKDSKEEIEIIYDDSELESRKKAMLASRTAKSNTLFKLAGLDFLYSAEGKIVTLTDKDGNSIVNTNDNQDVFFDYFRNPNNSSGVNGNKYSVRLVINTPKALSDLAGKKLFNTGESFDTEGISKDSVNSDTVTIKAVLYNNGKIVEKQNSKGELVPVYTTIHLPSFAVNLQGTEEQQAVEQNKLIAFRQSIVTALQDGNSVYVDVTGKTKGHLNFDVNTKNPETRLRDSVVGRIPGVAYNGLKKIKLFFSKRDANGNPIVTMGDEVLSVDKVGGIYVSIKGANGTDKLPLGLLTRRLNRGEAQLVYNLLKYRLQKSNTLKNQDGKTLSIEGNSKQVGILEYLIPYGPNVGNPDTRVFIKDDKLYIGSTEIEASKIEENSDVIIQFLLDNKIHNVSEKLANKGGKMSVPRDFTGDKLITEELEYNDFLFGNEKTNNENRILTTDLSSSNPVIQPSILIDNKFVNASNKPAAANKEVSETPIFENLTNPGAKTLEELASAIEQLENNTSSTQAVKNKEPNAKVETEGLDVDIAQMEAMMAMIERENDEKTKTNKIDTAVDPSKINEISGLFRLKLSKSETYVREDLSKAEAWFKERFPNIDFNRVVGLIESRAFGEFKDAAVLISELAEVGTTYHEAFHVVSQLFMTKEERDVLYNEVRVRDNKDYSDLEAEEILAEEYREHVLAKGETKVDNAITKFFKKLYNFIKKLIYGPTNDIEEIFNRIDSGYYVSAKPLARKTNTFNRKFAGYSILDSNALVEGSINFLLSKLTENGFSVNALINSQSAIRDILYGNDKLLMKNGEPSLKGRFALAAAKNIPIYLDAYKQFDTVVKNINENLSAYSIQILDEQNEFEESDQSSRGIEDFQESIFSSAQDGLPPNIKLLIATLPSLNPKGERQVNSIGMFNNVEYKTTVNDLFIALAGQTSIEKMEAIIAEKAEEKPEYAILLKRLNTGTEEEVNEIKNTFRAKFAMTNHTYMVSLINDKGNIYFADANTSSKARKIKEEWKSNLLDSKYYKNNSLDKSVLQIKDNKEFLESLGIKLSNPDILGKKTLTTSIGFIRKAIEKGFENNGVITDIFEIKKVGKRLNNILAEEAKNRTDISETQFIDYSGKTAYAITLNNYLSTIVNKISNSKTKEELFAELPHLEDIYKSKTSSWLNTIVDRLEKGDEAGIKLGIIRGMRQDKPGEEGVETSKLTAGDLMATHVNAVLKSNYETPSPIFIFRRPGDKKLEYAFDGFNLVKSKQEAIDIFFNYFLNELSQINKGKQKDFMIFEDILSDDDKKQVLKKEINTEAFRELVTGKIESFFNEQYYQNYDALLRNKVIHYGKDGKNTKLTNNAINKDLVGNTEEAITEAINTFTYNQLISAVEQTLILTGNLSHYKDFFKRTSGLVGTGKTLSTDNNLNNAIIKGYSKLGSAFVNRPDNQYRINNPNREKVAVIKKAIKPARNLDKIEAILKKEIDTRIKDKAKAKETLDIYMESYKSLEHGDGAGYVGIESYRNILIKADEWYPQHEVIYNKIQSGEAIKAEEMFYFPPLKPQYFGPKAGQTELNPAFLKFALFPLIKSEFSSDKSIDNLIESMQQSGVGMAVFSSAIKVGEEQTNDVYNEDGSFKVSNLNGFEIGHEYLKIQLDVNPELKYNTIDGTQQRKLIFVDQFDNGVALDNKVVALHQEYNDLYVDLINQERESLLQELSLSPIVIDGTVTGYTVKDYNKFVKTLLKEIKKRDLPQNIADGLAVGENGQLIAPIDSLPISERIQNLLMSRINKNLVRTTRNGSGFIQMPSLGFESKEGKAIQISNQIKWSRYAPNSYEVSSQGDKRFSALLAKLNDGRTIEEAYQLDIKGYRSKGNDWRLGKGKPPIVSITKEEQWKQYKQLWKTYLNENPELEQDLLEKAQNKTLTDKFASTDISQARALAEILNETYHKQVNLFTKNDIKKSDELKFLFDENGNITAAEVYLPNMFKGFIGNIEDIKDERLKKLIGYRIPTQAVNSTIPLIIKGFLPEYHGNTIIVPREIVGQQGSDFDVDKLNVFIPNFILAETQYRKDLGKKFKLIQNIEQSIDEEIDREEEDRDLEGNQPNKKLMDAIFGSREYEEESFNETIKPLYAITYKEFQELKANTPTLEEYKKEKGSVLYVEYGEDSKSSRKAIENRLLEIQLDILLDPNNSAKLLKPVSGAALKKEADDINKLANKGNRRTSATRLIEWLYEIGVGRDYNGGKDGVGITAKHNAHHSLSQQAGLYLNNMYKDIRGEWQEVKLNYKHKKNNDGKISLSSIQDTDGNLISETISEVLTGFVDIANDPFITTLNLSPATANTFLFMVRSGVSKSWALRFMTQPVIKEYIAQKEINDSEIVNKTINSNNSVYKKREVIVKELINSYLTKEEQENLQDKMYSQKDLEKFISEGYSEEFKEAQVQLLKDYLRYEEYGQMLSDIMKASEDDTRSNKNLTEAQLSVDVKNKVIQTGFAGNYDSLINNTILKAFDPNTSKFALKAFNELFFTERKEVKDSIKELKEDLKYNGFIDSKIIDKYKNFYINALFQKFAKLDRNAYIQLLVGKDSLGRQLMKIKNDKANPLNKNIIIKEILVPILSSDATLDNIRMFNKRLDKIASDKVTEGFEELFNIAPYLSEKIINLALMQSGLENNAYSYLAYLPAKIFSAKFKDSLSQTVNSERILDLFYENNSGNKKLVPSVSVRNDTGIKTDGYLLTIPKQQRSWNRRYVKTVREGVVRLYRKEGETDTHGHFILVNIKGDGIKLIEAHASSLSILNKNNKVESPTRDKIVKQNNFDVPSTTYETIDRETEAPNFTVAELDFVAKKFKDKNLKLKALSIERQWGMREWLDNEKAKEEMESRSKEVCQVKTKR